MGVMPKPLWFDVYAAFPPLREPLYRVPRPRLGKVKDVIPPVFYPEDRVRAKFYRIYGSGPKPFDLSHLNYKSTCQRFVEKYNELKEGKIEEEKLFEETGKALLASGIILLRRGTDKVAQQDHRDGETRDSVLHLQLQTVLEEIQEKKKDQQEQMSELPEIQKENP
ncbi:PREDICTED: 28S ribosomal protein S23, mitochondrial [Pterocles gutturalis]|uniref:28S ribosomal protein S23, mitochondrial n=1 Tax=Pterocles gutturalis TaxID=240206 RepID=UPI00052908D1|nr:PREDICTED: 28S ribosomal protein S23, mitochondrial [Pterocles gutturalis]